ncbi:MAG: Mur ligase family protein, partial [Candidatus Shapirobacteria bacterium]|nr:Mur ligase family protein [Candidatus Shapirobacteria bacterium]
IGITGSYGKTNTVKAIEVVLKKHLNTITTDTNLDSTYNLPITILKISRQTEVAILEYCVDQANEMIEHLRLVKPTIGIVTGITPVHSEKNMLGSIGGIMKEKGRLIESLPKNGRAILNFDDPWVVKMANKAPCPIITYGSKPDFDFYFDKVRVTKTGTTLNAHFKVDNKPVSRKVSLRLLGQHFAQEAMAALAVASLFNIDPDESCRSLAKLTALPGRMSLETGPKQSLLINDSLRANPASTTAGLKTLSIINHQGPRIAVLGEMGELGQYQEQEHYRVGQYLAKLGNIDYLVALGPATKKIVQGAIEGSFPKKQIFYANNHQEAAEILKKLLNSKTLWYLKGSLLKHMERILLLLSGNEVACQKISCHNYHHCSGCKELNPNR